MVEPEQRSAEGAMSSGTRRSTEVAPSGATGSPEPDRSEETYVFQAHSGPIPAPWILSGYDEVESGLASQVVGMAKEQQAHDHRLESTAQAHDHGIESRGQIFAFVLALAGLGVAGYLLAHDKSLWGAATVLAPFVGLVGLFAWGPWRERAKQRRQATSSSVPPTIEQD